MEAGQGPGKKEAWLWEDWMEAIPAFSVARWEGNEAGEEECRRQMVLRRTKQTEQVKTISRSSHTRQAAPDNIGLNIDTIEYGS